MMKRITILPLLSLTLISCMTYEPVVVGTPEPYVRPVAQVPTEFDERWYDVRPRVEEAIYPNVPVDWEPMPNPRFAVPEGRPLEGLRIAVDAGHGGQVWGPTRGYTGGTRGGVTGLPESTANLRTAFFLWDLLTQAGAEVTMTRTGPDRMSEPVPQDATPEVRASAKHGELHPRNLITDAANCDYFITIHHNAGQQTNYVSCYYYDTRQWDDDYRANAPYIHRYPDEELNRERYQLTQEIQSAMSRTLDLRVIDPAREWGRMYYGNGVPAHDINVLRESNIAGVLVEVSFMPDPEEDYRLNDPARAKQAATGVFEGILSHFQHRPMTAWSERPLTGP